MPKKESEKNGIGIVKFGIELIEIFDAELELTKWN